MEYSNTTTKDGLLQDCEFWTNLGDGVITGDSGLKARFTGLLNRAFDEVLPIIFSSDAKWQWDDSNHTDHDMGTTPMVAGQADYSFIADEDGNSILEIEAVYITNPSGWFVKLAGVDSESDVNTAAIFEQNSDNTGTPTRYDKRGSTIWLDPIPNYAGSVRAVFSRTPSYFVVGDTTKKPGIPAHFRRLLSLIASRNWLAVNKSQDGTLLGEVKQQIADGKLQLAGHMSKRSKDEKSVVRPRVESSR